MYLKLMPSKNSGEPVRFIPYLQSISIEMTTEGDQLAVMCHTTDTQIFIEGRGLGELAAQISDKRVKSIHVFDSATYPEADDSRPTVTNIKVEKQN